MTEDQQQITNNQIVLIVGGLFFAVIIFFALLAAQKPEQPTSYRVEFEQPQVSCDAEYYARTGTPIPYECFNNWD